MDAIRKREPMVSSQGCVVLSEIEGVRSDESELLRAGQAGDFAALDELLERHKRPLLGLCCGILGHADDAEDAVQETFLRALRALASFRGDAAFRTWLFRIAVNVCLRWKAGRHPTESWDEEQVAALPDTASPEAIALGHLRVMEALNSLPPERRAILLLKEREGWSVAEIALTMRWNEKRVRNQLYKARLALVEWRRREADEGEDR
jgi:RNA polymerase sigma-70 factor, ECF subfamily